MAATTDPAQDPAQDPAAEAMDWLAGRLRWERILRELHEQAAGTSPDALVVDLPATAPASDDEAA